MQQVLRPAGRMPVATAQGRSSHALARPLPALSLSGGHSSRRASGRPRLPTPAAAAASNHLSAMQLAAAAVKCDGSLDSSKKPEFWSFSSVSTHINVVIAGSHQYVGRAAAVPAASSGDKAEEGEQEQQGNDGDTGDDGAPAASGDVHTTIKAADAGTAAADEHAAFLADPDAWQAVLNPIPVHQAGRELLFTFQDTPGLHGTLDFAAHLRCLLTFILRQQEKDYKLLHEFPITTSSSLKHSTTVLFYLLPPQGPLAQLDLLLMAALGQHVPLVPVIVMPDDDDDSVDRPEADAYHASVAAMLKDVRLPGLQLGAAKVFDKFASADWTLPLLVWPDEDESAANDIIGLLGHGTLERMLEHAASCYAAFCASYEECGQDVDALVAKAMQPFDTCLPSSPAATVQLRDKLHAAEEEARAAKATIQKIKDKMYADSRTSNCVSRYFQGILADCE